MNSNEITKRDYNQEILDAEDVTDLSDTLPVHPTKKPTKQTKINKLVVHMTDGVVTARGLAKYDIGPNHISKTGCPTITYHYLIHQSGDVDKCVNHSIVTWHAGNHNRKSLALALNYKGDNKWEKARSQGVGTDLPPNSANRPTSTAIERLLDLLHKLCLAELVSPVQIFGHRELKGTGWTLQKGSKRLRKTCPGMAVDLDYIRDSVTKRVQQTLKSEGLYGGRIDGYWGKKSKKAFKVFAES